MTAQIYPWQQGPWQRLMARKAEDRMPHALLLSGPQGMGKAAFAEALAAALLCEESAGPACGRCPGCQQFAAGNHPDYSLWEPEEDAVSLKIHQVRELGRTIHLTRGRAPFKVAVLRPADALTDAAADSLLKTLEEPPPQTVLVLVAHLPGQLTATIRSRCQQLRLAPCYGEPAAGWLAGQGIEPAAASQLLGASGGAPLKALALAREGGLEEGRRVAAEVRDLARRRLDPVAVAERWAKAGLAEVLPWVQGTVQDAIRLAFDPAGTSLRFAGEESRTLHLSFAGDLPLLFDINARLTRLGEALARRHSVSPNGLAEQIAVPLYRGARGRGTGP